VIVDVHAHYIPKNFSELMGNRFPPRVGVPEKRGIARHRCRIRRPTSAAGLS
jgi:hypothetical protein